MKSGGRGEYGCPRRDDDEYWHLSLGGRDRSIEKMRYKVWMGASYFCVRYGSGPDGDSAILTG